MGSAQLGTIEGIKGLVVLGHAGEGTFLTQEEQLWKPNELRIPIIRRERPELQILSCHDEYLLHTSFDVDGFLVGYGNIAPEPLLELLAAGIAKDYNASTTPVLPLSQRQIQYERREDSKGRVRAKEEGVYEEGEATVNKWFDTINDSIIYYVAHALDPRCKFTLIREQYDDLAPIIEEQVKEYWRENFPSRSRGQATGRQLQALERPAGEEDSTPRADDVDRFFNSDIVRHYVPCVDWHLQWYCANEFEFLDLALAARAIFAIPAAEVDVERLFSDGRDIIRDDIDKEKAKQAAVEQQRYQELFRPRQVTTVSEEPLN
ncbi:hypothetical protein G7Y89_g8420 [Cudoniella acicularis]|uniref:HAT C-terminal dimerisation domain-containing protein n=1 Tax=Cudoniella acicularis TaxID=354080 RepID=A0A8H4RJE0_9HELO|nr:hypothetical protein G7Y89_g8420 [Cudoniella acicularis]